MSEPAMFEICFPAHITRVPVCRPGETIAGVVVLKLTSPLVASHLQLRFCGAERVRRSPVAVRTEQSEKKQQQTAMLQKMVMDKEFFRRDLVLWGEPKHSNMRIIPCDSVHRFHFSFTMPYVNMPTPRQTPDIEISYSLEASLFSETYDQQRGEKVLRDIHKTSAKCFRFEPVVQQLVNYSSPATRPHESTVPINEAVSPTVPENRMLPATLLHFQPTKKTLLSLNVFHSNAAYLPGETVELLLLAPANKKITNASFQLRETVRCRKSSAPIIDESDVPILWKYSVDLSTPQEIAFGKLAKANIAQDVGMLGRFLFTGTADAAPGDADAMASPLPPQSTHSSSDASSAAAGDQARSLRAPEDGLAISNLAARQMRGRTGSLGTIQVQQLYAQGYAPGPAAQARARPAVSASISTPYHPASAGALASRMSKISPADADDSNSDRSSVSDTLSIRYQPTKSSLAANFPSLNRNHSSAAAEAKYAVGVTPVPLGDILAKGSYKFAKIKLTLPPITDMSPVSSVYMDFEYSVDINMTIGSSFGTSKKAAGRLPLRIATVRTAAKPGDSATPDGASHALTDPAESTRSLRDSMSCLNLSIAHSDDALANKGNGSPANTLTEIQFEGPGGANDGKLTNGCYPCLLSFIQNGDKIPMPELEAINIGSNLM
ncbi:hypothetical protein LPJ63_002972 [Coemansia sp. RSA 2711]|nr:hypothetical protein LPJ63_002972 [Coemansia sp. RSA 2711]